MVRVSAVDRSSAVVAAVHVAAVVTLRRRADSRHRDPGVAVANIRAAIAASHGATVAAIANHVSTVARSPATPPLRTTFPPVPHRQPHFRDRRDREPLCRRCCDRHPSGNGVALWAVRRPAPLRIVPGGACGGGALACGGGALSCDRGGDSRRPRSPLPTPRSRGCAARASARPLSCCGRAPPPSRLSRCRPPPFSRCRAPPPPSCCRPPPFPPGER